MADEGDSSKPVLVRVKRRLNKLRKKDKFEITPVRVEVKVISEPTGFKQNCSVRFQDGEFIGLPLAWELWLQESNIKYVHCNFSACLIFIFQS